MIALASKAEWTCRNKVSIYQGEGFQLHTNTNFTNTNGRANEQTLIEVREQNTFLSKKMVLSATMLVFGSQEPDPVKHTFPFHSWRGVF